MSSLIVEVAKIDAIQSHGNADKLELAIIKGWQCVVPKGKYSTGQLVTYIPIDSVLPLDLSERLGVTKYLSSGRVRCAKLRGEPSFGLIMDRENDAWGEGSDVREHYGITKYIPPAKLSAGDAEADHPLFTAYTDIENMRNFPAILQDGEQVVATEKIHGTNCRVGRIEGEPMAGSKGLRRKHPEKDADVATNLYWHPWSLQPVKNLMASFNWNVRQVILFGEVYGKVQSLRYGIPNGIGFRAFDLLVDGKYLDYPEFIERCASSGVETVPTLYLGPFGLDAIRTLSGGPSTMPNANHIREGVVVKPVAERTDPKIGRVILKYISDSYLLGSESDTNDI